MAIGFDRASTLHERRYKELKYLISDYLEGPTGCPDAFYSDIKAALTELKDKAIEQVEVFSKVEALIGEEEA